MKLNEDNTITLSFRETRKFITKVINPEYKVLERLRKYGHITTKINQLEQHLKIIKEKQNQILNLAKDSRNVIPTSTIKSLQYAYFRFIWTLEGIQENSPEEVREIESAYQLYTMLLKNRRFKEEDEQTSSLSEMPEQ
jgi:hypothetical protein